MTGFLLLALGTLQGLNPCDVSRAVYTPCVGTPVVLWFCGPPATGSLTYTLDVDGVRQPTGGQLVRWGTNMAGDHLEPPSDISLNGKVQYTTSHPVALAAPGAHNVTVTYGSQTATVSLLAVTKLTSPVGGPDTVCPAVATGKR